MIFGHNESMSGGDWKALVKYMKQVATNIFLTK